MNKNNEKSMIKWNTSVLNAIAKKYGFTSRYIKQIVIGDRTPIFSDRIKAEYKKMTNDLNIILNDSRI